MYKSIFIDLDDTVWAFSDNSHDTFKQMYDKFDYSRFFSSFNHFYSLYSERNRELWVDYGQGKITKDELNKERFSHPLRVVGVGDDNSIQATNAGKILKDYLKLQRDNDCIPTRFEDC